MLVLIPTRFEAQQLWSHYQEQQDHCVLQQALLGSHSVDVGICGFGLAAAGGGAAHCLEQVRDARGSYPSQVILLGIAGSYHDTPAVGEACLGATVNSHGIGVGSGPHHTSATTLGWQQALPRHGDLTPQESLPLYIPEPLTTIPQVHLCSCAAASASTAEAAERRATLPTPAIEDMEAFAVALACRRYGIPLSVVRGISNRTGDRTHAHWQVATALQAAAAVVEKLLQFEGASL